LPKHDIYAMFLPKQSFSGVHTTEATGWKGLNDDATIHWQLGRVGLHDMLPDTFSETNSNCNTTNKN